MSSLNRVADTVYALKFLKLLTDDWEVQPAYKLGIIDKNGKRLKTPRTTEEKEAYTIFDRLIFNIKRLLPNGKFASYASALFLIREHTNMSHQELIDLFESVVEPTHEITEHFFVKDETLMPGKYKLKESVYLPDIDHIARAGTLISADTFMEAVDYIGEVPIFKVRHVPTNKSVYISPEDITR